MDACAPSFCLRYQKFVEKIGCAPTLKYETVYKCTSLSKFLATALQPHPISLLKIICFLDPSSQD